MSAGDFDYESHGQGYAVQRRTDPRIAAQVHAALGEGRSLINVGAGAGSYEPEDRYVVAVEPSAAMRAQRPATRVPALNATAEDLPFDDGAFDAALASITVHQWKDRERGLRELRRVSRGPVVVMTFDGTALDLLWLGEYAPELFAVESPRYPDIDWIAARVGGTVRVETVAIPIDCVDGFTEAYYARPERLLDPLVRKSQSAWGFVDDADEVRAVERLRADLESGAWDARFGHLRSQPEFLGSLRLIIGLP
ncbi:class I SAM-dependent methyltransferase [Acrocarpospora corrugata]|nr:methyltransferase domain-containing protein [Acrocarpospora corrugata]